MYEQILVYNYFFHEITGSGSICIWFYGVTLIIFLVSFSYFVNMS